MCGSVAEPPETATLNCHWGALLYPPGSQGLKLNKKTPHKPTKPTNSGQLTTSPQIEITLENGRKLSVSGGVDAGFVLELARGLAA